MSPAVGFRVGIDILDPSSDGVSNGTICGPEDPVVRVVKDCTSDESDAVGNGMGVGADWGESELATENEKVSNGVDFGDLDRDFVFDAGIGGAATTVGEREDVTVSYIVVSCAGPCTGACAGVSTAEVAWRVGASACGVGVDAIGVVGFAFAEVGVSVGESIEESVATGASVTVGRSVAALLVVFAAFSVGETTVLPSKAFPRSTSPGKTGRGIAMFVFGSVLELSVGVVGHLTQAPHQA